MAEISKKAVSSHFREILDNSPNLIVELDLEGRYLMVNRAVSAFFGRGILRRWLESDGRITTVGSIAQEIFECVHADLQWKKYSEQLSEKQKLVHLGRSDYDSE